MKISELKNAPQWLIDAETANADVTVFGGVVTWNYGIWEDGIWKEGTWEGGTWEGGFIYDKDRKGNFESSWEWRTLYVYSPINPKDYFKKK